jgi:predicted Abi (CAAX) family protease
MLKPFLTNRYADLKRGIFTVPRYPDLIFSAIVFGVYTVIAVLVGFLGGFFEFGILKADIWIMLFLPIFLFFIPSIFEEFIFRGLLLPHKQRKLPRKHVFFYSVVSILVFVGCHPLNGLTLARFAYPIFINPAFLFLATLMAIACTITYLRSGSIWIPVCIHWLTVLVWVFLLGGKNSVILLANKTVILNFLVNFIHG